MQSAYILLSILRGAHVLKEREIKKLGTLCVRQTKRSSSGGDEWQLVWARAIKGFAAIERARWVYKVDSMCGLIKKCVVYTPRAFHSLYIISIDNDVNAQARIYINLIPDARFIDLIQIKKYYYFEKFLDYRDLLLQ